MNTKVSFSIIALVIVASTAAVVLANSNVAFAAIHQVPSGCINNGGNYPGGQQPICTGGGLAQEFENQNPAGFAPPGQNK